MNRIRTDQNRKQAIAVLFWRLVPILLAWCCDVFLTLLGQPADYWQVSYEYAEESNVIARPLLMVGPWAFVALAVAELIGVAALLISIPKKLAGWVAVVVTFAHALGAGGWFLRFGGWWCIGCVVVIAVIAEVAHRCWGSEQNDRGR